MDYICNVREGALGHKRDELYPSKHNCFKRNGFHWKGRCDSDLLSLFVFFHGTIIPQSHSATINEHIQRRNQFAFGWKSTVTRRIFSWNVHQVRIHHQGIEEKIDGVFRLTARIVLYTTRDKRKWWLNECVEEARRRKNCYGTRAISKEQCRIADDGTWPIFTSDNTWTMTCFLVYEMWVTVSLFQAWL